MANPEDFRRRATLKDLSPIYSNGDPQMRAKGEKLIEWMQNDFVSVERETYINPDSSNEVVDKGPQQITNTEGDITQQKPDQQ